MRAGGIFSLLGHIAAALTTLLTWPAPQTRPRDAVVVVPIEIVDIGQEANIRALAQEVPEQTAAQEETPPAVDPAPAPAPVPAPRRPPNQRESEFDLADISGMIDRQRNTGQRRQEGARAERNQRGAGPGTAERATLESRASALVNARLRTCWRSTEDLPDPGRLIVTVSFQLSRSGALVGQPTVISPRNYTFDPIMSEAVNRALRAVRVCDLSSIAEDPIVGPHFDVWRDQEVTFGRRD